MDPRDVRRLRVARALREALASDESAMFHEYDGHEVAFDGELDLWVVAGLVLAAADSEEVE